MLYLLNPKLWIGLAIVALVSFGLFRVHSSGKESGRAEIQAKWDKVENQRREVAERAEKESKARERSLQEKANAAIAKSNQRAINARADAASARSELDRLRNVPIPDTVSSGSTEATCRTADDRTRAVRELLSACSAEYEDMARAAGGHLRDSLSAREAWPN